MSTKTRLVRIGDVEIGAGRPVAVQSMTNTETKDLEATVAQIHRLEEAGCELIRVGLPDRKSVEAIDRIKERISIPLIADIHFHADFAVEALERGADKVRINPGNIGTEKEYVRVLEAAAFRGAAVRVGVNSGSLHRKFASEPDQANALVKSCLEYVSIAEAVGFTNLVLSVKSSSVTTTIAAYRMLSQEVDYPLHLGVTEAGTLLSGAVRSAAGLGVLLTGDIGDTIRVSLAADPVKEVQVGFELLRCLELRTPGPVVIACPTCARREIDVIALAEEVERRLLAYTEPIRVAVMGCPVNGPGEAAEADVGIAGGRGSGILYREGRPLRKVAPDNMIDELFKEVDRFISDRGPKSEAGKSRR